MASNKFKKEYLAVVSGILPVKKETINKPIARKPNSIIERCISSNGKQAITHFEVLQEFSSFSLVKCTLETGRTHQIRVHFASIGHPLALACSRLSFYHPVSNNYISFCLNDCPFDFL